MAQRIAFLIMRPKSSINSIEVDQGSIQQVIKYFMPVVSDEFS